MRRWWRGCWPAGRRWNVGRDGGGGAPLRASPPWHGLRSTALAQPLQIQRPNAPNAGIRLDRPSDASRRRHAFDVTRKLPAQPGFRRTADGPHSRRRHGSKPRAVGVVPTASDIDRCPCSLSDGHDAVREAARSLRTVQQSSRTSSWVAQIVWLMPLARRSSQMFSTGFSAPCRAMWKAWRRPPLA